MLEELPVVTTSASYHLGGLLFHRSTDGPLQGHQWPLLASSMQRQVTICPYRSQHLTRWPRTTPSSISMGTLSVSHCSLLPPFLVLLWLQGGHHPLATLFLDAWGVKYNMLARGSQMETPSTDFSPGLHSYGFYLNWLGSLGSAWHLDLISATAGAHLASCISLSLISLLPLLPTWLY